MNDMDDLLKALGAHSKTRRDDPVPPERLAALITAFHETEPEAEVEGELEEAQSPDLFFDGLGAVVTHLFEMRLGGGQASHRGAVQGRVAAASLPHFSAGAMMAVEINPKSGMAPFTPEAVVYLREPGSATYRPLDAQRRPQPGPLPGWVTYHLLTEGLPPETEPYELALLLLPQELSAEARGSQPECIEAEHLAAQAQRLIHLSFVIN